METNISGPNDMNRFAADFVLQLTEKRDGAVVIALSGDLGSGKTTFTQAAAKALGVEDTVNSPTFVIEKIYALSNQKWQKLVHIDAYRLKRAEQLKQLGWDEIIGDPSNLVIIEWPEHVQEAIPQNAHRIGIGIGEGESRTISYGS